MPKRPTIKKPKPKPEPDHTRVQLSLLDYAAQVEQVMNEPVEPIVAKGDRLWQDLPEQVDDVKNDIQPKLEPIKGRCYVGKSVTGKEFAGFFGFITQSGLWAIYDNPETRKPIALIVPETAREVKGER